MKKIETKLNHLLKKDPLLQPFSSHIKNQLIQIQETENRLTQNKISLEDFASGHEYFGLHFKDDKWIFREWAPNATAIYLIGDMSQWKEQNQFALKKITNNGVWEIELSPEKLAHTNHYRLRIHWPGSKGDRIPSYARRVVQDPSTLIFNAQVWTPPKPYQWKNQNFKPSKKPPFIYEAHIGMAQDEEKIATYQEFTKKTLKRIKSAGYNTIQLMAIQEHPYYASFGYQVSSFFAPSSRFGTPQELKILIDKAHKQGFAILMDLIHSHSTSNEVEGLSRFDGTTFQYFHEGYRGQHQAWQTRCFDYNKTQVLHFLLSNCRYWLDEFHLDGFRFDGVTSMIYKDHGLKRIFTSYNDYFCDKTDQDALTYIALANKLIHNLKPNAITIAEDVSGMPDIATPLSKGGYGFDYRFSMGVPDYWIKLVKNIKDENWPIGHLWYELNNRRKEEKTISYVESHDQALVGDQTLIFRLIGENMYNHMDLHDDNPLVARGIALQKMIKLITLATAGSGYLNFMGNEFGHPEWIDFPREGNNWSFEHAKRKWSLVDNPNLKYKMLANFDRDMIIMAKTHRLLKTSNIQLLHLDLNNNIITFTRANLIFIFNFHPNKSFTDYQFQAPPGEYQIILDSDAPKYAGYARLKPDQKHFTLFNNSTKNPKNLLSLYLPAYSTYVLAPVKHNNKQNYSLVL